MGKLLRKQPIQRKLLLAISLMLLVVMVIMYASISRVLYFDQLNNMDRELTNTTQSVLELVDAVANLAIEKHLEAEVSETKVLVNYIYNRGIEEGISSEEMTSRAAGEILKRKIGKTGYVYVINSQGIILVHPYDELEGTSAGSYGFVQAQIKLKSGYLEYLWQNPGDTEPREKALSMNYFEPWDWIISASAYRQEFSSLIDVDDVKKSLEKFIVGKGGFIFILDNRGNLLLNSDNSAMDSPLDREILEEMGESKNGRIEYQRKDSLSGEISRHIILFRYLSDHEWVVASSLCKDEYTRVLYFILLLLGVIFLGSFLLFLGIGVIVSRILTTPLKSIVRFMNETSFDDLTRRIPIEGKNEFSHLSEQINHFLDAIEAEQNDRLIAEEENRILAQFTNGNPYPVMRIDKRGFVLYVNKAGRDLMKVWNMVLSTRIPSELMSLIKEDRQGTGDLEYIIHDRTYHIMFSFFENQGFFYLLIMDITERKGNEVLLLMSEGVFSHTTEGIVITDPQGAIIRVNPAFTRICGYTEKEVLGENPRILKSHHHEPEFYRAMWESLTKTGTWSGEIWNRRKNNEAFPEWLTINGVYDERDVLLYYVAVFKDISDIKESEEKLRHQVSHDALTGLPNRILFEDRLHQAIARAERNQVSLAVLFLDMDNFKHINDSLGHQVGDSFLVKIAARLKEACRDEDTVARVGGDEFVILLTEFIERINVVEITQRLLKILGAPLSLNNHDVIPSASIGITVYPDDGRDSQRLLKNADLAMYKAKALGKGTYSLFNQEMNAQVKKRLELESRLLNSLLKEEMTLVYQPKVSLVNLSVTGVEALIRWNNTEIGFISPIDFIPLAEETGFIMPLGDWILEKALTELKEISSSIEQTLEMAVNLSVRQFWDKELIIRIERILESSGIDPALINLEITENMAMEDSEVALEIMDKLIKLGITLSIDDFGTGYSSYSYLKRFQAKYLKIDKSFVDHLPHEEKSSAIMENLIDLGHTLGMEVVAEGVEVREQYEFLKETGCDVIQGYFFSKPLKKEELISFINRGVRL